MPLSLSRVVESRFDERTVDPDPIAQFRRWLDDAQRAGVLQPDAMILEANPRAAVVFHWPEVSRQVRATGPVERVSTVESQAYWATRPRESQVSAWASEQSEPIESREELERRAAEVAARFDHGDVPLPPFWGGYRVVPDEVEFWCHRDDRLHDRLRYTRRADGSWAIERLQP
jgi:pyridoxamine 5'-phosphate oxidase